MKAGRPGHLIRHIHAVMNAAGLEATTDAELLDRCLVHRDDRAFEMLLRRYGPLVWSLCRRVLGDSPDAEDAFSGHLPGVGSQGRVAASAESARQLAVRSRLAYGPQSAGRLRPKTRLRKTAGQHGGSADRARSLARTPSLAGRRGEAAARTVPSAAGTLLFLGKDLRRGSLRWACPRGRLPADWPALGNAYGVG